MVPYCVFYSNPILYHAQPFIIHISLIRCQEKFLIFRNSYLLSIVNCQLLHPVRHEVSDEITHPRNAQSKRVRDRVATAVAG